MSEVAAEMIAGSENPAQWPMARLGDVAPSKPLRQVRCNEQDDILQITLDHIESDTGDLLKNDYRPLCKAGGSTHYFSSDHVLYSKLRPYLNKVYLPSEEGVGTSELVPMLPDKSRLTRKYLAYYLRSEHFVNWVSTQTAGAKMPRVSMRVFWDHKIPLPPLSEQKRIAAILDKADAIRRKRQQAKQLADDFLRSVFLDMFGDPVTNPKEWTVELFGEVGTLDRGKSKHRPRNDPILLGGSHPLIQTGDVANSGGYIREYYSTYSDEGLAQSKMWESGTLCITIAATIAKTGILTFPACFPDSVVGFVPGKTVTVEYVQHWLGFLQKLVEDRAPAVAQKNINLRILKDLDIPVPSIGLQKRFSSIVENINGYSEKSREGVAEVAGLFGSLSQRAFAGDLILGSN